MPIETEIAPVSSLVGTQVPTHFELLHEKLERRKSIADLPKPPSEMNTVSLLIFYEMLGLSDAALVEILTPLDLPEINAIRLMQVYKESLALVVDRVKEFETKQVRQELEKHALAAVDTIVDIMKTAEKAGHKLAAAKDILDRGGYRPNDVVEHKHSMQGGLKIEVVQRRKDAKIKTIDVTPTLKEIQHVSSN